MLTFAIIFVSALLSWRFLYPPLAIVLFMFLDPSSTAGTAAAVPYSEYTCSMVWGGLLGGALTSLQILYKNRTNDSGGVFAWRVAMICVAMFFWIRISVALCGHYYGAGNDTTSGGPLTLIIVLAYLWDRHAWLCFGLMLVAQLGLSMYVIVNPDTRINGVLLRVETGEQMERTVSNLVNQTNAIGTRFPGQFSSTIAMAAHAAVGIAMGIALLADAHGKVAGKKIASMAIAAALIIAGVYLLGVSASRGIMLGLVFGIVIHFLNARGPQRFIVMSLVMLAIAALGYQMIDMIPEDDPLWGRFVSLRYTGESEDYRIEAMRNGVDAVLGSPMLGWGDFDQALEACDNYVPHIGPYFIAVFHGIPVGLLACVIIALAGWSDLTGKNVKALELNPEVGGLCAFATMSCWVALTAIFTNGYTAASFLYILLGIAMWPMIPRPVSEEEAELEAGEDGIMGSPDESPIS